MPEGHQFEVRYYDKEGNLQEIIKGKGGISGLVREDDYVWLAHGELGVEDMIYLIHELLGMAISLANKNQEG